MPPTARRARIPIAALAALAVAAGACSGTGETDAATPVTDLDRTTTSAGVPNPPEPEPSFEQRMAQAARPSADAGALAARLETAHAAFDAQLAEAAPDERALQVAAFSVQTAYRQLARNPEWDDEVVAALPVHRQGVARSHVAARREFRGMHRTLSETVPAWRIVAPAPVDELRAHYEEGEAVHGVPWRVLAAVNLVETAMGRIQGLSVAGARGPMQFMPGTWEEFGSGDIDDPRDAILAAARYLAHNGGAVGELENALFRYNNADAYVRGVLHYVDVLEADPTAHELLHRWQVVYLSAQGDLWLAVGDGRPEPQSVADYVAAHPLRHLGTDTR